MCLQSIGFSSISNPYSQRCFRTDLGNWIPSDGDTLLTDEGFVFNVFGYEHPNDRVVAFLKYVPAKFKALFSIDFLERTWRFGKVKLFRAEKLYTANNYQVFLDTFKNSFPDYVYFCPYQGKEIISVPLDSIEAVYIPKQCLNLLAKLEKKDSLQKATLALVGLLSDTSGIAPEDFGVHGSVALNMHTSRSDIDIVVYGALNFRLLERTISKLVQSGTLTYQSNNRLDAARLFKGRYEGRVFMYNAIRKREEARTYYGMFKYSPITPLTFFCEVKDDSEAMFRPATYRIKNFRPSSASMKLERETIPGLVVSMIGCYRNVARCGDRIRVTGMLERVENLKSGGVFYQVVVGTGILEEEKICPI